MPEILADQAVVPAKRNILDSHLRNYADFADKPKAANFADWENSAEHTFTMPVTTLLSRQTLPALLVLAVALLSGCAAFPDRLHQPQFHNPFPQLHKVAVLPFFNQSREPTIDGEQIAISYYNELQLIPGFEVMPVGVAKQMLAGMNADPHSPPEFQQLARAMGVDVVLVGSVTEYSPYYPPRMGLAVDWYAANPGFHPIPAGYGLPWGTPEEEFIPQSLVKEAEFALAREQLKTQTPSWETVPEGGKVQGVAHREPPEELPQGTTDVAKPAVPNKQLARPLEPKFPAEWPNPKGFIPPPPSRERPPLVMHRGPIISHTKIYHGNDSDFTQRLASYHQFRDEARFGGWQSYLQRPDDFIRFCCYLHLTETLAARGGAGESRVVWRWPINRYER